MDTTGEGTHAMNKVKLLSAATGLALLLASGSRALATDREGELARKAENPVTNLISFPLQLLFPK